MTANQVWMITGAGRGLGVDIAKAALAAACELGAPPPCLDKDGTNTQDFEKVFVEPYPA